MAVLPKVVATVTTLGGSVGAPLLFWKTDSSVSSTLQQDNPQTHEENSSRGEKVEAKGQEPITEAETKLEEVQKPTEDSVQPNIIGKGGNCKVIDTSEEKSNILWNHSYKRQDDYLTIVCKNTNQSDEEESKIPSDWLGLLPKSVITNSWNLRSGNTFDITTKTTLLDSGNLSIIFSGNKFEHSSLVGECSQRSEVISGKEVTVVKMKENIPEIFLLFEDELISNN
ncbi:hypothetical protein OVS_01545 [Mycoplasma ovis str. Michigan]|uniref:Uncharacterized protein n=1 Tax=Mycoplasma ovis str. Michigan TaxID=1415773 RepID=A0ABM5P1A0_9MOLU|nr:hypothetical protein [Mycoplasma ovis]AHC40214.1 hypothetical protein OVS_01545 [Mycoplasma ovis str. Michigan]